MPRWKRLKLILGISVLGILVFGTVFYGLGEIANLINPTFWDWKITSADFLLKGFIALMALSLSCLIFFALAWIYSNWVHGEEG